MIVKSACMCRKEEDDDGGVLCLSREAPLGKQPASLLGVCVCVCTAGLAEVGGATANLMASQRAQAAAVPVFIQSAQNTTHTHTEVGPRSEAPMKGSRAGPR